MVDLVQRLVRNGDRVSGTVFEMQESPLVEMRGVVPSPYIG